MKHYLKYTFFLSLLFMLSCTAPAVQKKDLDPWLKTISGNHPHEINIAGKWKDTTENKVFGWGEGYILQEENKISGVIGAYNIKGVVSGKKIYLAFLHGGTVHYTAKMVMIEEGLLVGNYFYPTDLIQEKGFPISLKNKK